jgi:hypothetical protein
MGATIPKNKKVKIARDIIALIPDESRSHHFDSGLNRLGHAILRNRRRIATGMS